LVKRLFRGIAISVGVALALAAVSVLVFVLTSRFWLHEFPFMGESFTQEKWAEAGRCEGLTDFQCAAKENECPRGPMVRSLRRNYLTVGTSRAAVIDLLGPDDFTGVDGPECLSWSLGMCSGLGWDYDSLFVCFDEKDLLVDAGHVQH
jgi:hypothetical protein